MTQQVGSNINRVQTLEAIRIHACPHCQAPGVYKHAATEEEVAYFRQWSGCLVEARDQRAGRPVGDVCPNCEQSRLNDEHLGVIWRKES